MIGVLYDTGRELLRFRGLSALGRAPFSVGRFGEFQRRLVCPRFFFFFQVKGIYGVLGGSKGQGKKETQN